MFYTLDNEIIIPVFFEEGTKLKTIDFQQLKNKS